MDAIYGKKGIKLGFTKGYSRNTTIKMARGLVDIGAQGIIAGCTEFSLVISSRDIAVPLIDPLDILARAVVSEAKRGPTKTQTSSSS